MTQPLIDTMVRLGGALGSEHARVTHFGDPATELRLALDGCALADRGDAGRLLASGPDILDLLHRLSTADLKELRPGQGAPAVLLTGKGRIVQRIFVHHLGETGVLILAGPQGAEVTTAHLRRFTFAERTGLSDAAPRWERLALFGPRAREVASRAGWNVPPGYASGTVELAGHAVRLLGGDGLSPEGLTLLVERECAGAVWEALCKRIEEHRGGPVGALATEAWRVLRGLPENGAELTEQSNPLEAGLWEAVSFEKGCYVGQEVVARLRTYDKVSRELLGMVLPEGSRPPATGTPLTLEGSPVGQVTSALRPPGWSAPAALAFVKRKSAAEGSVVRVDAGEGPVDATLRRLPLAGPDVPPGPG